MPNNKQLYFHKDGTASYTETQWKMLKYRNRVAIYKIDKISVQYKANFVYMEMQFLHHLN